MPRDAALFTEVGRSRRRTRREASRRGVRSSERARSPSWRCELPKMANAEVLQLDVWKGDWGLPSVDVECLQVLAYAKFSGIPLKVNLASNLFRTPHGRLPLLKAGLRTMDTVKDILPFFRTKHCSSDCALSDKQCADVMAYDALLKEKLYPAFQFIWWIDKKNLDELVRPWYCKALSFPFNFYYPGKFERQAQALMQSLYPLEDNINVIENEVYSEAQKCLTLLSTRLGDKDFFCGQQPSTIDAVVYSYLAPLLKAPLPNPILQNHLKACTNLVKYVSRISQRYFEKEYQTYEKHKAEKNAERSRRNSESEFPNKRRNQVLAALIAIVAMAGYALSTGIVEVPVKDDEIIDVPLEYILNDEDDE
ncbi:PREDICTED: metaxin-1 isoform X2 [Vollenhovia emeryi]|uniref:metaxin-1 isoform X2 n=1 Tax=Vollenhovia emeryi TaxID=411798 RepID=UPI0005F3E6F3|nr:PREDICTED: metaxin-1 isoform X2 [Vollenhovia emeryi]